MPTASDFNRSLSRLFTNPVFKQIIKSGNNSFILSKLKKYDSQLSLNHGMQVKQVLANAYKYLGRNYRNEYLYKNTIVNNILLGRHSIRTATMLNEFKVGSSIADVVVLNGTSTVYEIKTELDSPDKLQKQIEDYRKVFVKTFLVTHHSLANKYLELIKGKSTGLLALSDQFRLSVIKDATEDYSHLCIDTMMRCLRKEEYTSIVKEVHGDIPKVSNINFFRECLAIANNSDSSVIYDKMLKQLKRRSLITSSFLESEQVPKEIKHICLCINPSKQEYNRLIHFLNLNL